MKKFKENNKGFSLVELIVVIAIMVVLIAVLGSTILGYVEKSKYSKDISALDSINTAVKTFVADPASEYTDGAYSLQYLIDNCDKGNVIAPILSEVFTAKTTTSGDTTTTTYTFNAASKSFKDLTASNVCVQISQGAVGIYIPVVDGTYAPYSAGGLKEVPKSGATGYTAPAKKTE